jgi:hypothetical protein
MVVVIVQAEADLSDVVDVPDFVFVDVEKELYKVGDLDVEVVVLAHGDKAEDEGVLLLDLIDE